jgi:hypothetical protein
MDGATRQMTWQELCDEMVKQRERAEAAEVRIKMLEGCVRLTHDVLRRVPTLAQGPSRELWDGIMVDVLDARRQCAACWPFSSDSGSSPGAGRRR